MTPFSLVGSLGNLFGPDMMVIGGLYLVIIVGGFIQLVWYARKRGALPANATSSEERLQKLVSLRRTGLVTEEEYAEQRRRILAEI